MLKELLEFVNQALIWWNFIGASIAIYLGILEFRKKRVSIEIKLGQNNFVSNRIGIL